MSALYSVIDSHADLLDAASLVALGVGTFWLVQYALNDFARAWRRGGDK